MNASQATLTMVLLFALRCLLPMVLMFGIGYTMNWLVDRWEMEEAEHVGETAVAAKATDPCWAIKKCDPELRKDCPGFKQQMIPCWLARTQAEGALPEGCTDCPLYQANPSLA